MTNVQVSRHPHKGLARVRLPESRGQAIVLIALLLVILVAIAGLAIDGGQLLFLKRDAQNAADAAVLAAANARCDLGYDEDNPTANESDIEEAGYLAAEQNGFDDDTSTPVSDDVEVNWPIGSLPVGAQGTTDEFIEVNITADADPYFIQVVYQGPLQVQAYAVARCVPEKLASQLYAMTAFAPCGVGCDVTLDITGSDSTIEGGVASNCECKNSGASNDIEQGEGDAAAACAEGWQAGEPDLEPSPTPGDNPTATADSDYDLIYLAENYAPGSTFEASAQADTCAGFDDLEEDADGDDCYHYYSGDFDAGNGNTLEGLYYVEGDVSGQNPVGGDKGLVIVALGAVSFSGGAESFVTYHEDEGFLLIMALATGEGSPSCNADGISLSGQGNYRGTFYAPYGECQLSFSNTTMIGAILCYTINTSGSNFYLIFDPQKIPPVPPGARISQ